MCSGVDREKKSGRPNEFDSSPTGSFKTVMVFNFFFLTDAIALRKYKLFNKLVSN